MFLMLAAAIFDQLPAIVSWHKTRKKYWKHFPRSSQVGKNKFETLTG